jgi:hypothetical protein
VRGPAGCLTNIIIVVGAIIGISIVGSAFSQNGVLNGFLWLLFGFPLWMVAVWLVARVAVAWIVPRRFR